MTCPGFLSEEYDLYALGALESAEAEEIRAHLLRDCGTCLNGVRASQGRMAEMAMLAPSVQPSRSLRQRITGSVKPAAVPASGWLRFAKFAPVFAALLIAVGLAGIWLGANRLAKPPAATIAMRETSPPAIMPPVRPVTPEVSKEAAVSERKESNARDLANARASLAAVSEELTKQRQAAGRLEDAVRQKDAQIRGAEDKLSVELARSAAMREELAKSNASSEGARAVAALQGQIEVLSRQVALYRTALQRRRENLDRSNQLVSFLSVPGVKLINLAATEHGGKSSARALVSDGGKAVVYATGLPPLERGRDYQLWILRAKGPAVISGGVFRTAQGRDAIVQVENAVLLSGITGMAVTEEPAGGSRLPTGPKVLIGSAPRS